MELVNLCLKIPNLGILVFYLIFIVIIPFAIIASRQLSILKYYLPILVALAHLLTYAGPSKLFENLYVLKPNNFVSFISSNFINLLTLYGIIWQCLENYNNNTSNLNSNEKKLVEYQGRFAERLENDT